MRYFIRLTDMLHGQNLIFIVLLIHRSDGPQTIIVGKD